MTVEDFEEWLEQMIASYAMDLEDHHNMTEDIERLQREQGIYADVLKKYKSILPPPTTLN